MNLKTSVQHTTDGGISVSIHISKLDLMASDRADKLLNYILIQIGDRLAEELVERYRDEIYSLLTPEKILSIVADNIKKSIKIGEDNRGEDK